jgi:MFS family permease
LFVWWELRAREPLVQLRLFQSGNFTADSIVIAAMQFGLMGVSVFGAIWVQDVLGFGPITAGLSLLPLTIPLLLLSVPSGRLYDRIGPRLPVAVGALLLGLSLIWTAVLLDQRDYAWLVPGYVLMGVGLALMITPTTTDALNAADPALRGQASGVVQTMRQVGGTVGIAILGTIVAHVQTNQVTDWIAADPAQRAGDANQIATLLANPDAAPTAAADPSVVAMLEDAVTTAISASYWVAGAVSLLAAIVAAMVLRRVRAADAESDDVPMAVG